MDITSLQTVSEKIYLREISNDFALLEGNVKKKDWAWVTVRVADVGDNIRRAELLGRRDVKYLDATGTAAVAETIFDNPETRAKMEVWYTLEEFGNLTLNKNPLFPITPVRGMLLADFEKIWHALPIDVATAIYAAVLSVNRAWLGD
jgi:hypothetical protein